MNLREAAWFIKVTQLQMPLFPFFFFFFFFNMQVSIIFVLWFLVTLFPLKIHTDAQVWSMHFSVYIYQSLKSSLLTNYIAHKSFCPLAMSIQGYKCIPSSQSIALKCHLTQKICPVHGGIPHSIYFLWLRWLSTREVFVQNLGGGCWWLLVIFLHQVVSDPIFKVYDKLKKKKIQSIW